jgi:hypothetical protein
MSAAVKAEKPGNTANDGAIDRTATPGRSVLQCGSESLTQSIGKVTKGGSALKGGSLWALTSKR